MSHTTARQTDKPKTSYCCFSRFCKLLCDQILCCKYYNYNEKHDSENHQEQASLHKNTSGYNFTVMLTNYTREKFLKEVKDKVTTIMPFYRQQD